MQEMRAEPPFCRPQPTRSGILAGALRVQRGATRPPLPPAGDVEKDFWLAFDLLRSHKDHEEFTVVRDWVRQVGAGWEGINLREDCAFREGRAGHAGWVASRGCRGAGLGVSRWGLDT